MEPENHPFEKENHLNQTKVEFLSRRKNSSFRAKISEQLAPNLSPASCHGGDVTLGGLAVSPLCWRTRSVAGNVYSEYCKPKHKNHDEDDEDDG